MMLSGHDVPVTPGHNRYELWGGGHDGATREISPGSMPVIRLENPGAVYVYRPDTGRYEYERPAVQ